MSDTAMQLAILRAQRDASSDSALRAALDAAIAALEKTAEKEIEASGDTITVDTLSHVSGAAIGAHSSVSTIEGNQYNLHFSGLQFLHGLAQLSQQPADYTAALQRYLAHLYHEYAGLDLRGIDDRPLDMPLSELYVSLRLHEPPPDALMGRGALRGFMRKVEQLFGARDAEHDPTPKPIDWTQALRHSRLAVIGAPGSGKTTLLHYTAVRLAEVLARDDHSQLVTLGLAAQNPAAPPVPLFLPLRELGSYVRESSSREWAGAGPRLLLDCLANYYARFDLDLPDNFFRRLCKSGRALLLLDGLDEVASTDDRALVSSIVRAVVGRYHDCRYVVTSRVAAYHGDAQIGAGFRICTVADLDEDQQQRFIQNWSRSLHRLLHHLQGEQLERRAQRYTDDLWTALQTNARVRELATNPLLLTVVTVIFYNNYVLPEDRAALYEECIEVLLRGGRVKADRPGQQRREYAGRPQLTMGLDPKREILSALAYRMHQRGEEGVLIQREELVQAIAQILEGRYPEPAALARSFVDELPVHIGLLDEREPDRFRFSHLSFQEFLAARHIAEAPEERWDELLHHYQESWWREVILLCAGHLSQERCWRFLERLIQRGMRPEDRVIALGLASDALAELERFKGQGPLNASIQADALRIVELRPADAAPAHARVTCGRVLARLGDPRPGVCSLPPVMVEFQGGDYVLGLTNAEIKRLSKNEQNPFSATVNEHESSVAAFALARYPVTNGQWACFMDAGGYDPAQPWWDDVGRVWLQRDDANTAGLEPWQRRQYKQQPEWWDDARLGRQRSNHPVVGISWYEAMAFCCWLTIYLNDGSVYTLPSELEWEYAARGATRRIYPWGNDHPDAERANYAKTYTGTTAVGCFPQGATPEGLYDMAGNVWEWTRSAYRPYPYNPADGRESGSNPEEKFFTLRGGDWNVRSIILRASFRYLNKPNRDDRAFGFRLARHPHV